MAAFTNPNINFQAKELMREIEHSFYERYRIANALGSAPSWAVSGGSFGVGANLQDSALWISRQQAFIDLLATLNTLGFKFMKAATPDSYQGEYAADLLSDTYESDVTALWQESIGQNGPRRYLPDGFGGVALLYGIHQPGDFIGPWLYEDMQQAFRALRYTLIVVDNSNGLNNYVDRKPPVFYDAYGASPPLERGLYAMNSSGGLTGWPDEPMPYHFRGYWGRQYYAVHDWNVQINDHNTQVTPGFPAATADVGSIYNNPMVNLPPEEYDDSRLARRCLAKYYTSRIRFTNGRNIRACTSVTEYGRANILGLPTSIAHRLSAYAIVEESDWVFFQRNPSRFPHAAPNDDKSPEEDPVSFMPFSLADISGPDQLARIKPFEGSWSNADSYSLSVDDSTFSISKYMGPSAWTNDSPPIHGEEYGDPPTSGIIDENHPDSNSAVSQIPWYGYQLAPVVFWVADWQWAYT